MLNVTTHTLRLANDKVRRRAHRWIDAAPVGCIVRFDPEPKRSLEQNSKLWAMLSDVASQVEHNGRKHTPEAWKFLFMHACGHETRFEMGLSGEFFPVGFRSSALSVREMAELIEFIYAYGAEKQVRWKERGYV